MAYETGSRPDEQGHQPLELVRRVLAQSAVPRAGLDDRRPRRGEPAEPSSQPLEVRQPPPVVPAAHGLDRAEQVLDRPEVEMGRERSQPVLVDVVSGLQEVDALRIQDDPDVDELLALDAWHAAEGDVLVPDHAATAG